MTSIAQRRVAGATALMILLYLLQVALFASPANAAVVTSNGDCDAAEQGNNYSVFTFNFVNGTTVTGDNCVGSDFYDDSPGGQNAFFPGTGGAAEHPNGPGMDIHVSCSTVFTGGWANDGGDPDEIADPNWQIASYSIEKFHKGATTPHEDCAETFFELDAAVQVSADCVVEEEQAYFYADVLVNATLLVDLTGDGDFNDGGAGESLVSPGNPGFIYDDTAPGGTIAWEATATAGHLFSGGVSVVSGTVVVPDCETTTTTTEPTTTTTEPTTTTTTEPTTTTTTQATTTTTQATTTTTQATTTTTQATTTTTQPQATTLTTLGTTTTLPFDSVPEEEVEVLGTTITTAPSEVSADTLPFTGFEAGDTVRLGLLAMVAGLLTLFAAHRPREEEATAPTMGSSWSDL